MFVSTVDTSGTSPKAHYADAVLMPRELSCDLEVPKEAQVVFLQVADFEFRIFPLPL
jgi:hypothetical protein